MNQTLNLSDAHARMGKIGNNIEMHGEEEVSGFTLPITMTLGHEQLDGLMGKYFHRSLYNQTKDLWEIVDGFRRCKPLHLEDIYEEVSVLIDLAQGDPLEFSDCRVSKIVLTPQHGGLTLLDCHLYLHPGLGDENLALQEHQNHEIGVTLQEGKIALKKNPKQGEMAFAGEKPREVSGGFVPTKTGADIDAQMNTGEVIDGRSERVKHQDQ